MALERPSGSETQPETRGEPPKDEQAVEGESPRNAGASQALSGRCAPERRDDLEGGARRVAGVTARRPQRLTKGGQEQGPPCSAPDAGDGAERGEQRPGKRDVDDPAHGTSVNEAGGPHGSRSPSRYGTTDHRP